MASTFPVSKDALSNPSATDELVGHAAQHANANDAIEALENVIGITNSTDSDSLTYKINALSDSVGTLSNTSASIETLMGLEGNNDLTIAGIQNKTTVDSYASADYRTASYALQIVKTSTGESYFSNITALRGASDIYVSESNIVTNANSSIATTAFESANGIISLTVTPVSGEVTVRYFRTALK
jgi:hypothetical protein